MSSRHEKISKNIWQKFKISILHAEVRFFCFVIKRSYYIFQLIKANVEKLLKFHSDFKVKHDALVRAGVAAATKFSRINLIQLWQFDVRRVLIFILIFHPFEQSLISWPRTGLYQYGDSPFQCGSSDCSLWRSPCHRCCSGRVCFSIVQSVTRGYGGAAAGWTVGWTLGHTRECDICRAALLQDEISIIT